jgi:TrmH family RNA methyltransferase
MQTITSLRNPVVFALKALQTRRGREESGLFLCDGEHMVAEAAGCVPQDVRTVFVEEGREDAYAALLAALPAADAYTVPRNVLCAVSGVKTPQGIAAAVRLPRETDVGALGGRVVLLENVQDPGNVGTVLRTADAAGFSGCVLTPGCADPFSPKALRATMGSVFRVPLHRAESAAEAIRSLKADGYAVIASMLDGDDFYARSALPRKLCLIIGNEGAGVTPQPRRSPRTATACRCAAGPNRSTRRWPPP